MTALYQTSFDRENGIGSIIETLGGSDVTQIFVHNVTSLGNLAEYAATVQGIETYDERALVVARPDDLVCVVDRVNHQYLQFLSIIGIGPINGNVVVASESVHPNSNAVLSDLLMSNYEALLKIRKLVKRNNKIVLNPFIASPKEFELARILEKVLGRKVEVLGGNSEIVDYANHKHNVKAKALELGVPVPKGDTVELQLREDGRPLDLTPVQVAINRYIYRNGRVIVKGSYGASGSSIIIVENNSESIEKALSEIAGRSDNGIYLVEVMLDVIVSPNVLMHIEPGNGRILRVSVTDQRLGENLMHEGNIYPTRAKTLRAMISSAQNIAKWLQHEGYSGIVGFDFGEYLNHETGELEHVLFEINPRINGAAYPKSLMEHFNKKQGETGAPYIEAFLSANVKTKASSFAELDELYGDLFFNPKTGKGLVPYNTGCLENGKFSLTVFGKSRKEVVKKYEDFKQIIAREDGSRH